MQIYQPTPETIASQRALIAAQKAGSASNRLCEFLTQLFDTPLGTWPTGWQGKVRKIERRVARYDRVWQNYRARQDAAQHHNQRGA